MIQWFVLFLKKSNGRSFLAVIRTIIFRLVVSCSSKLAVVTTNCSRSLTHHRQTTQKLRLPVPACRAAASEHAAHLCAMPLPPPWLPLSLCAAPMPTPGSAAPAPCCARVPTNSAVIESPPFPLFPARNRRSHWHLHSPTPSPHLAPPRDHAPPAWLPNGPLFFPRAIRSPGHLPVSLPTPSLAKSNRSKRVPVSAAALPLPFSSSLEPSTLGSSPSPANFAATVAIRATLHLQ